MTYKNHAHNIKIQKDKNQKTPLYFCYQKKPLTPYLKELNSRYVFMRHKPNSENIDILGRLSLLDSRKLPTKKEKPKCTLPS